MITNQAYKEIEETKSRIEELKQKVAKLKSSIDEKNEQNHKYKKAIELNNQHIAQFNLEITDTLMSIEGYKIKLSGYNPTQLVPTENSKQHLDEYVATGQTRKSAKGRKRNNKKESKQWGTLVTVMTDNYDSSCCYNSQKSLQAAEEDINEFCCITVSPTLKDSNPDRYEEVKNIKAFIKAPKYVLSDTDYPKYSSNDDMKGICKHAFTKVHPEYMDIKQWLNCEQCIKHRGRTKMNVNHG